MQFPTPYIRHFCLSQTWCSFLQHRAPFCWPPLAQKAHPFTSIAYHFDKDLRRILVNILLIVVSSKTGPHLAARHYKNLLQMLLQEISSQRPSLCRSLLITHTVIRIEESMTGIECFDRNVLPG